MATTTTTRTGARRESNQSKTATDTQKIITLGSSLAQAGQRRACVVYTWHLPRLRGARVAGLDHGVDDLGHVRKALARELAVVSVAERVGDLKRASPRALRVPNHFDVVEGPLNRLRCSAEAREVPS